MLLCPFEDSHIVHLRPLVDTRPVYGLRTGIHTLLDALRMLLPATGVVLHTRAFLAATAGEAFALPVNRFPAGTDILFVNGRYVPEAGPLLDRIRALPRGAGTVLVQDETVVAAYLASVPEGFALPDTVTPEVFDGLAVETVTDATFVAALPDLVHGVRDAITRDYERVMRGTRQIERPDVMVQDGAFLIEPDHIFMGKGCRIHAATVVDASNGPVYFDDDVVVWPGAIVRGPVFVGAESQVKALASIEGTAIGPGCKVSGEVHTSVFHSCSTKGHQGFVGHTYVGQWCNFGADTNTSNLRNDYGPVSLYDYAAEDFVDTGHQFMGLVMADHAKCSINTMFNTGTVVGVGSNLYGAGFHDRFVPGFSWGEPGAYVPYRLDKFLRVAEVVMPRRNHVLTPAQREMLTYLHAHSHAG